MNGKLWKILLLGDIVSNSGCDKLYTVLPALKREKQIDVVIANGENAADGNGITPYAADRILNSGVDLITGGNHTFRRREFYDYLDENPAVLRPANYKHGAPGRGYTVLDKGAVRIGVLNLLGTVFMEPLYNPFDCADEALEALQGECDFVLVDFHAEATAEKRAMGFYLDGRVAAVVGTHTHVQTADAEILEGGTAYMTDLGMTGPKNSVLGVCPELAIQKMRTNLPVRFQNPKGECSFEGLLIEVDKTSGRAVSLEPIRL